MTYSSKLPTSVPMIPDKGNRKLSPQTINFIAGGIAGSVASTITTPLEVVKTQLQSSLVQGRQSPIQICRQIMKNDGPLGFLKGIGPTLVGIIPTRAIYFWAYSTSKAVLAGPMGENSPLNHLLSAFAAGITSNTVTNPIWMVKTRFQLFADAASGQRLYSGYLAVIRDIWREEGPPGFFKGLSASYVGCIEGAVQWMVYEKIKKSELFQKNHFPATPTPQPASQSPSTASTPPLRTRGRASMTAPPPPPPPPPAFNFFVAGAVSKFLAVCTTYPHEVVRTRLREQARNGAFKYRGFVQTLSCIAREEGVRGLYGGMGMHLLRSVPNAALMFATFELTARWMAQAAIDRSEGDAPPRETTSRPAPTLRTGPSPPR